MGTINDRRQAHESAGFRSAGTHFQFKNGWLIRLLVNEPAGSNLLYEVSVYDPDYRALVFGTEGATSLFKVDSDNVALILSTVRSFGAATKREETGEFLSSLIALSI
jgi:hypothetical protein